MRCRMQQHHHRRAHAQRGFSLPELAVVMVSGGLILGPSLTTISSIIDGMHERQNIIVLETARDALITFAGAHGGCLPFAADYEGGQPNTDQNGAPSPANPDTGIGRADSHGGDLPWAELGLGNNFLDHDGLRVQYYVASQYTDIDADSSNGINCAAGQRGTQWNSRITYDGTGEPQYVYYESPGDDQELYKIVGVLPAGTPPRRGAQIDRGRSFGSLAQCTSRIASRAGHQWGERAERRIECAKRFRIDRDRNKYQHQRNHRPAVHA